jgi:F-type H+-transporting ATPase subunit gamma
VANTIAIRRRIRSVTDTRQMTKAMQMVSASKLRAATAAALNAARYRDQLDAIIAAVATDPDWSVHPLLQPIDSKVTRIVLFGSDRGLAGAFHSRLELRLRQLTTEYTQDGGKVEITAIGKREAQLAQRQVGATLKDEFGGMDEVPHGWELRQTTRELVKQHLAGEIGRVIILSTRFHSALRQEPELTTLLPLSAAAAKPEGEVLLPNLEPNPEEAITAAAEDWLVAALLDAASSSLASEHAMRMLAMQNATDNAGDMIDDLTLEYNRIRQAAITQELAEISGGAAAIEEE